MCPAPPKLYRNPVCLAQEWQEALDSGQCSSRSELALRMGVSAQVEPRSSLRCCPSVSDEVTEINWHRLGKLALVGIATFAAIWIGGVLLALL